LIGSDKAIKKAEEQQRRFDDGNEAAAAPHSLTQLAQRSGCGPRRLRWSMRRGIVRQSCLKGQRIRQEDKTSLSNTLTQSKAFARFLPSWNAFDSPFAISDVVPGGSFLRNRPWGTS
jgi:hypothetical protein